MSKKQEPGLSLSRREFVGTGVAAAGGGAGSRAPNGFLRTGSGAGAEPAKGSSSPLSPVPRPISLLPPKR